MSKMLHKFPVRVEPELQQQLDKWNSTQKEFPLHQCAHQLFEAQVLQNPDSIAISFNGKHLTYLELNHLANRMARFLVRRGVGSEILVALLADRSSDFLTAILAVFKAGGAYLPLDPLHPTERLRQVLMQSRSPFLLTTYEYLPLIAKIKEGIDHDKLPDILLIQECMVCELSTENLPLRCGPNNLAYVIMTSGSTGLPKGAMVEHRGMLNHLYAKVTELTLTRTDCVVQNASQCFDISVWQFLAILLVGGKVTILTDDVTRNPIRLLEEIEHANASIFEIVPSLLRAILEHIGTLGDSIPNLGALRWLILTGEALPVPLCRQWLDLYPNVPILNAYGPTECSDDVTHYPIFLPPHEDLVNIPIGRPIANIQLYVLEKTDTEFRLCGVGVSGELYVTGVGVGRGYINDPERTTAVFFQNPFSDDPSARMYRTGDLVQYLPDGNIVFLGRIDRQVKIRGFRIELGEIESVLLRHIALKDCAVVVYEAPQMTGKLVGRECLAQPDTDVHSRRRLIAYIVLRNAINDIDLRAFLHQYLPEYMVPEQFIRLDALPLNSNGKLDQHALPKPGQLRPLLEVDYLEPRTSLESLIARLWQDVLALDRVGVNDNFFELGGDSLLAMQVLNRLMHTTHVTISFTQLFAAKTVSGLAKLVEMTQINSDISTLAVTPQQQRYSYPLSTAQQRLWLLWKLDSGNPYYTFQGLLHLHGPLNLPVFRQTWEMLLEQHETLRTRFYDDMGIPYQIFGYHQSIDIPITDLSILPVSHQNPAIKTIARQEAARAFDLESDPLLRIQLLKLGEEDYSVLLTMHEIILDGWSTCVLIREFGFSYNAFLKGENSLISHAKVKFKDFILWEEKFCTRNLLNAQETYWHQKLSGVLPILDLPTDHPRPAVPSYRGDAIGLLLDNTLSSQLKNLASKEEGTLFMTLLAAFATLLNVYTGQVDFIIGTPFANRNTRDTEDLVGFFLNMLPLRLNLSGDPQFVNLLRQAKETVIGAINNADYPFLWMVETINAVRDPSVPPVFQVMFNMLSFPQIPLKCGNLEMAFREIETGYTKYDITLYAQENDDQIYLQVSYLKDLFNEDTIKRMLDNFAVLLKSIVNIPESPISELEILSPTERKILITDSNKTERNWKNNLCIHQLFENQVLKTPQKTAFIFNEKHLTYGELNTRANQLAHFLRHHDVGTGTFVAICLERSFEMIIAILGVLKAGGVYVPLEPSYPPLRRAEILSDTKASVFITKNGLDQIDNYSGKRINIDNDWSLIEKEDTANLISYTTPENLINVVYTSSSTGLPKGVLITIKAVLNRLFWMWDAYPFRDGDVLAWHKSYALVAATWEAFGGLLQGIPTIILSRQDALDPVELWKKLISHKVSYFLATPSMYQGILEQAEYHSGKWSSLRIATTSAEPITPAMIRQWKKIFPNVALINLYGSTECSSNVTQYITSKMPNVFTRTPIGTPLPNTKVYILDDHSRPVPIGVIGEMCVEGVCVSPGYLNRLDMSAKHFVPSPFSKQPHSLLYKTGDLARYLVDGNIDLVGRKDRQVKIRGFRVELGDIEATLSRHDNVKQCAVILQGFDNGAKRLVAHVECVPLENVTFSSGELRKFLRERLPEFMIPSDFMLHDTLPLTHSGKIDYHALPQSLPWVRPELDTTFQNPRTPTEKSLAEIWSDVLKLKDVGIFDNFFDLGGHSLLAAQVIDRTNRLFQISLPLRTLFDNPTVADIALVVSLSQRHQMYNSPNIIKKLSRNDAIEILTNIDNLSSEETDSLLRDLFSK